MASLMVKAEIHEIAVAIWNMWARAADVNVMEFERTIADVNRDYYVRNCVADHERAQFEEEVLSLLRSISNKEEQMTLSIQGITDALTQAQAQLSALQEQETNQQNAIIALQASIAAEITAVNDYIANLQQQIVNGSGITQQDLDGLATQVTALGTSLGTAVGALQTNTTEIGTEQASVDGETTTVNQEAGTGSSPTTQSAPAQTPATGIPVPTPSGGVVHGGTQS